MDRTSTSFLKTPPVSGPFTMASPPELLRPSHRYLSPTPSNGRERSAERLPPIKLQPDNKMSTSVPSIASLLSPPQSPESSYTTMRRPSPVDGDILIPDEEPLLPVEGSTISLETPLFSLKEKDEPVIRKTLQAQVRKTTSPVRPSAEEYNVFVSTAWRLCQSDPLAWLRREKRHYDHVYKSAANRVQKPSSTITPGPRHPSASPRRNPLPSLPAVSTSHRHVSPPRPRPVQRPARAPRATPKMAALQYETGLLTPHSFAGSPTPAPRQRLTAPTREDSNFEALPDLTPPLSTLPNNKCLQTDWRGTPLAIENEPHFDKLHPAEVKLASTLRLTPAIYLSSKRRMFIGKVQRTQIGKEFRKTDAQKACKIDVNKASKLWTAFEKVGWLDRRYVEPHLHKQIVLEH